MENNNIKNVGIKIATGLILFGSVLSVIGFSLSGFEIEKYRSNEKRWYEIISLPEDIIF